MSVDIVLLDMDGVMADLLGGLESCLSLAPGTLQPQRWDDLAGEIGRHTGRTPSFARSSTAHVLEVAAMEGRRTVRSLFASLPVMPEAHRLVNMLRGECSVDLAFLSSPSSGPISAEIAAGKVDWILSHFPDIPWVITHEKTLLAKPGSLLIDDRPETVERFLAAGGRAIQYPSSFYRKDFREIHREIYSQAS